MKLSERKNIRSDEQGYPGYMSLPLYSKAEKSCKNLKAYVKTKDENTLIAKKI